ncbi:hypothetical protein M9H77_22676 [Catharanthus roseus]|uniref:Uncharacterized protein n=2 Tax=Catharanthus roseus TaxID=4058 RepID=A0ACC0AV90_CATRO|nr:hypothetical protein M9H77_22674 [Catharanthus roseus]KAI5663353.1 hypothetical protein M9H77_22676 [Catharanthus roseus]
MVDSSCGGTFLHKTADEAWDLFENLSDNSQQHATSSGVGTSRQIGNRGMYEVSQNVDLSLKVDALSKKFDQLLALNTLPTNSPNVQGVCAICSSPSHVIYDCPSASLFPEFVQEQVNVAQGFHRQNNPYSNTYNSGWRNHPNFSWKQQGGEGQLGQQQYQQNKQPGMTAPPGFQSQRYVPPHPPQSGNSIFEEKVLSALKGLESMTQILDSHTQSIAKLETQIGQLANAISRRDEGKLPSHQIENLRANYHEQAKAVITIRNEKLVDNKVGEPIKDNMH